LEGDVWKIKSLILRGFRQRVGIWQHFTNELILKIHEVGSSFYCQGGPEMAKANGGKFKS